MRLSKQGVERIRNGLIRSWKDGTHRKLVQEQEIDADTLRKRALYDRKGKLLLGGIDIHYSTNRSDQFDVYVRGELVCTGGPRVIAEFITNHE